MIMATNFFFLNFLSKIAANSCKVCFVNTCFQKSYLTKCLVNKCYEYIGRSRSPSVISLLPYFKQKYCFTFSCNLMESFLTDKVTESLETESQLNSKQISLSILRDSVILIPSFDFITWDFVARDSVIASTQVAIYPIALDLPDSKHYPETLD